MYTVQLVTYKKRLVLLKKRHKNKTGSCRRQINMQILKFSLIKTDKVMKEENQI